MALTEDLGLLEREQELAGLRDGLSDVARRRRGRVAIVAGEAGIGKSALLRRFCEEASRSARVLWAACDPLFTPRPLGPLLDIAAVTGGDLQAQVAAGAAPHDVAATLLRDLAGPAPAVLVVEDVHWADEATLDVLRLVARRIGAVPALLAVSFRDEQVGRSHPLRALLADLPANGSVTRIAVPALSPEGVAELAECFEVDPDELYARTGGNAFFVTEVLAAATEGVPGTIRDAVLARAARLSGPARAVLDAVAIVPQRTEVWLLEALDELAPNALEECLDSGVLRAEADAVAFRHELAQQAIEASVPPDRRVALHRRAVGTLAERPGSAELARLAHHAEAAGDVETVLRFARAAGEQAAAVGAHREAANQYARALRFAGGLTDVARAALLEVFAWECYLTDMRAPGIDALEEVSRIYRDRGERVKLAETLLLRCPPLICAGRAPESRAHVREAMALLHGTGSERDLARAYAECPWATPAADEGEERLSPCDRAVALAERSGDIAILIRALEVAGTFELSRGNEAGLAKLERSLKLSLEARLAPSVGRAYVAIVAALGWRREFERAVPYLVDGLEYSRKHGLDAWEHYLLGGKAAAQLAQGQLSDATDTAVALLESAWPDHVSARLHPLIVLALVRARRGDPERWPLLDETLQMAAADGSIEFLAPVAAARAEAAWLEGRTEAVEAETAGTLALAARLQDGWVAGELAVWRRRAGIVDELPGGLAKGPFALELAGDHTAAAEAWRELGMPYEAALALAGAEDEEPLRAAHEQLRALGARPAEAIVARRLRAGGARDVARGPNARTRENAAGLTRRELEVLSLVAEGSRNVDIAQRLVVSEKTVDHHVSAILRKLDVRTRGQAAAVASKLGLLEAAKT